MGGVARFSDETTLCWPHERILPEKLAIRTILKKCGEFRAVYQRRSSKTSSVERNLYCRAIVAPLMGRRIAREPPMTQGAHIRACTHSGGAIQRSRRRARATIPPPMTKIPKTAGPSAASCSAKLWLHEPHALVTVRKPENNLPCPHLGQRPISPRPKLVARDMDCGSDIKGLIYEAGTNPKLPHQ